MDNLGKLTLGGKINKRANQKTIGSYNQEVLSGPAGSRIQLSQKPQKVRNEWVI